MQYAGPDKEFGQHDDYKVGDIVHTYDNTNGHVVEVKDRTAYGRETLYTVQHELGYEPMIGKQSTYDGSRLALVARA